MLQTFLMALNDRLRPLTEPEAIREEAARALREHLGVDRVGYAEAEADGRAVVAVCSLTGDGMPPLAGRFRLDDFGAEVAEALRDGRSVLHADAATHAGLTEGERAAFAAQRIRGAVCAPLHKGGRLLAVLFAHHRAPRAFTPVEVALVEAVAERTWDAVERARAEAALREGEARLRLALDVADVGTWSWDLATGGGELDGRGAAIIGVPAGRLGDVAAMQLATIHPDDLAAVQAAAQEGLARGGTFPLDYRVVHPGGRVRHVASRAHVVRDEAGRPQRLVGTNRDVSAAREAAAVRERLLRALEAERRRLEEARERADRLQALTAALAAT
ncbi:PAS domain-containing protein, partial [Roseisolibacter sp. H3M3-2]|uniref:GAF domain-containing protein n=1 Tax=Roseisolibacter sp. H3M3-2 TaxID=3031323 RepID=UPI0023DB555D